jgi:hypothetical protein
MEVGAIATAFVASKAAETQMAVAAKMLRMNADAAASVVKVLEAAQQNMQQMANAAAGLGQNLDISV